MKAYKVVRNRDGVLLSFMDAGKYTVTYHPGKFIKPMLKESYLFCFNNKESALAFGGSSNMEVWECEIKEITHKGIFTYSWNIKDAWKKISTLMHNKKKITFRGILQRTFAKSIYGSSTIWAKQVKLTKRIK